MVQFEMEVFFLGYGCATQLDWLVTRGGYSMPTMDECGGWFTCLNDPTAIFMVLISADYEH